MPLNTALSPIKNNSLKLCRRRAQSVKTINGPIKTEHRDSSLIMRKATAVSKLDFRDNYFLQTSTGSKTSKSTLSKLKDNNNNGLPDPETFEKVLLKFKPSVNAIIKRRETEISALCFSHWKTFLKEGFNVLLYGVGSKREIIKRFRMEHLDNENCIEIEGYQTNIGIRQIMSAIIGDILQLPEVPTGALKQLEVISEFFSRPASSDAPLFLLIHNIDGRNLRTVKAQAILSRIAEISNIRVLASMDHINLNILWSQSELSRFSWIWEECSNFAPYSSEAGFANSRLLQQILAGHSEAVDSHLFSNDVDVIGLTRLRHVMASLTKNAKDIYKLLVDYQIQAIKDSDKSNKSFGKNKEAGKKHEFEFQGMPLEELYWRCRDAFLVNSESTLRSQLTEFKDHKLVKFYKNAEGIEHLKIPLDLPSLEEIIQNNEAFG